MQTEVEVKFLQVDHDDIRAKLKAAGAELEQPMRLMRRSLFDFEDKRLHKSWAHFRVRDEGDKVTMTLKREKRDGATDAHGVQEVETTVGDYEIAVELFKELGLVMESQQESKRENWELDGCEVVLDEWPWLKPYIEVEGPTEEAIRSVAKKLGFDWDTQAFFGSVTVAYREEYALPDQVSIGFWPNITFDGPMPENLAKLKRNKE
jgi:adenylate cyclase class 2